MQTPQGEALLAMTNERLPPIVISQAASQQLELLAAAAAESARCKDEEGVLQRRIAGIQENEITKALQDITLALVTHRLLHATLAMPDQTPRRQQEDATLDDRLRDIHPPSLQPLIDTHVALVVNGKDRAHLPFEPRALARVCTLEMGKMYAASVMHGYFLARVYQRFKLERALAVPMADPNNNNESGTQALQSKVEDVSMEAYLLNFKESFHHLNTVNCPHTLDVIERHCQAFFGVIAKPLHTSYILNIQLGSVRSLILQALAFGALLWDVENNFISSSILSFRNNM